MNEEIKARWVAALRDPEAKQGRGRLGYADGRRCCLGVLCDLAVQDGVIEPPTVTTVPSVEAMVEGESEVLIYDGLRDMPSLTVQQWAGFDHEDGRGRVNRLTTMGDLAELNDGGKSFELIAARIEDTD